MKKDCAHCGKLRTGLCKNAEKCVRHGYSAWQAEERRGKDRRQKERRVTK